MKKQLVSLGLTAVLFFGTSIPALAVNYDSSAELPQNSSFTGTVVTGGNHQNYEGDITMHTDENGIVTVNYIPVQGAPEATYLAVDQERSTASNIIYQNPYIEKSGGAAFFPQPDGSYFFFMDATPLTIQGFITLVDEPVINNQPFTGKKVLSNTAISDHGDYLVVFGGSFTGTFEAGRHEYSAKDQTIKVYLVNRNSGNTRSTGPNNIKKMYVTVSNGEITKVEFEGIAQTHPEASDTFTLYIES